MGEEFRRPGFRCSACQELVRICAICQLAFREDHVVLCRREAGHVHATCATDRFRKVLSEPPPPSGARNK